MSYPRQPNRLATTKPVTEQPKLAPKRAEQSKRTVPKMAKLNLNQIKQIGNELGEWKRKGLTAATLAAKNQLQDDIISINANPLYKGVDGDKARLKAYGKAFKPLTDKHAEMLKKQKQARESLQDAVNDVLGAEPPAPTASQQQLFNAAALEMRIASRTASNAKQLFAAVDSLIAAAGDSAALYRQIDVDAILDGFDRVNASTLQSNDKLANTTDIKRVIAKLQEGRYTPEQHEAKDLLDNAAFFDKPLHSEELHGKAIAEQTGLVGAAFRTSGHNAKVALNNPDNYGLFLDALQQEEFSTYVVKRKGKQIHDHEVAQSSKLQQYEDVIKVSDGRKTIDIDTSEVTEA